MILSGALNGTTRFRPAIPWPNQEEPSKLSWRTWQRYLHKFFATYRPTVDWIKIGRWAWTWVSGSPTNHTS
eukprot:3443559-Ditylum_brightwellii.AAC.1